MAAATAIHTDTVAAPAAAQQLTIMNRRRSLDSCYCRHSLQDSRHAPRPRHEYVISSAARGSSTSLSTSLSTAATATSSGGFTMPTVAPGTSGAYAPPPREEPALAPPPTSSPLLQPAAGSGSSLLSLPQPLLQRILLSVSGGPGRDGGALCACRALHTAWLTDLSQPEPASRLLLRLHRQWCIGSSSSNCAGGWGECGCSSGGSCCGASRAAATGAGAAGAVAADVEAAVAAVYRRRGLRRLLLPDGPQHAQQRAATLVDLALLLQRQRQRAQQRYSQGQGKEQGQGQGQGQGQRQGQGQQGPQGHSGAAVTEHGNSRTGGAQAQQLLVGPPVAAPQRPQPTIATFIAGAREGRPVRPEAAAVAAGRAAPGAAVAQGDRPHPSVTGREPLRQATVHVNVAPSLPQYRQTLCRTSLTSSTVPTAITTTFTTAASKATASATRPNHAATAAATPCGPWLLVAGGGDGGGARRGGGGGAGGGGGGGRRLRGGGQPAAAGAVWPGAGGGSGPGAGPAGAAG
mgnify:CR=1 FL=1